MKAVTDWLKEYHPRYELVSWAGNATSKSIFFDTTRSVQFECAFAILKRNLKRNPDTIFSPSKEEKKKLYLESHTKKYNGLHYTQTQEYLERRKATVLERYGVANVMQNEKVKENFKTSFKQKYGVEHPSQVEEIHKRQVESIKATSKESRKKAVATMKERYGITNAQQLPDTQAKTKETNLKKYGNENARITDFVKNKIAKTNLEKYGNEHFFATDDGKQKAFQSKIDNGSIRVYENKLISEWAEEKDFSISHFNKLIRDIGLREALKLVPGKTSIESKIEEILKEFNVDFKFNKQLENYRPDFNIESHKLIIEANGSFWHSDFIIKDKNYHKRKKGFYTAKGYNSLFFTDIEILNKASIVKSIIQNKLGLSTKIGARKCEIKPVDKKEAKAFFTENHLMGFGAGRTYGLYFENKLVCGMQIKGYSQLDNFIEVSRFCCVAGVSVIGGFTKLLKYAISEEKAQGVITFTDLRYGSGNYLKEFGFAKETEHLSFCWTNGKENIHRMKFPGNTGYGASFNKLWDCGQAKWVYSI